MQEFGTENKNGHLNCFLNVCLQALWQFPKVKLAIKWMLDTRNQPGSAEVQPFTQSLLDFYQEVSDAYKDAQSSQVPVLSTNRIRAELFKLNYDRNEFALHEKADAFEALDHILGLIHVW